MYVNDIIRDCDRLYPNEYSTEEKYLWIDEVSAMLRQEYLKKYNKVTVKCDDNGEYLLPEGVTFEMVDRVIDGNYEVSKLDFRSYGIRYFYGRHGRFVLPARYRVRDSIDVIYLEPYKPIRHKGYSGTAINGTSDRGDVILIPTPDIISKFRAGDIISIKAGNKEFKDIPLLDVFLSDDFELVRLSPPMQLFSEYQTADMQPMSAAASGERAVCIIPKGTINYDCGGELNIERVVTDETECPAPYDSMYIDYVLGKICYYQRDYDTYNQHMNLFNSKLDAFAKWLQERRTQDRDGQIVNWW